MYYRIDAEGKHIIILRCHFSGTTTGAAGCRLVVAIVFPAPWFVSVGRSSLSSDLQEMSRLAPL
jgi:hypothetical protein